MRGAGKPIWDDIARSDDLDALSPPRPDRLPMTPDVLVVGGGVVGLAIAAFSTRRGMDVLLVERDERLASGASGRAAGGLAPDAHPKLGDTWRERACRSLSLHFELGEEWDTGVRRTDVVVLPDLVIEGQAHVDPVRFCASLARNAGTVVTGMPYEDLREVRAANVVFATGSAPDDAGAVDQSWVKGHMVATEPVAPVLDHIVSSLSDDVLVLQLPSGHIVSGGTKEPNITVPDPDDAVVVRIVDALRRISGTFPRVTHAWTCFRPLAGGGLPVVSRVREDVWCAAGFHSTGILMAPVVGELVSGAIADGKSLDGVFG